MLKSRPLLGERWGLVALRVAVGLVFVAHGAEKVFTGVGGAGFSRYLQGLGFTPGIVWGSIVKVVELGGGLCLVFGVLVRPASILLIIEMLVATVKVNLPRGFYWNEHGGGWEMPVLLAVLAAIVALTGPSSPRRNRAA